MIDDQPSLRTLAKREILSVWEDAKILCAENWKDGVFLLPDTRLIVSDWVFPQMSVEQLGVDKSLAHLSVPCLIWTAFPEQVPQRYAGQVVSKRPGELQAALEIIKRAEEAGG